MSEVKNKSMSLTANCPSLEAAWVWAKDMSDKFGMPVNNFNAYKHSQKFDKTTNKYEDITPFYSCSVSLKAVSINEDGEDDVI